jgi:hypothetical protein
MFGKAGRAMNLRVAHPLRSLQRVGYANACIEILGSHPSQNPGFPVGFCRFDELYAAF